MNNFFKKNQNAILAAIVILGGLYVYKSFFATPAIDTAGANAEAVGNDIVTLNQNLEAVTLDQTLFNSPGYQALVDFTPTIASQPVGRPHPFNPLGQQ